MPTNKKKPLADPEVGHCFCWLLTMPSELLTYRWKGATLGELRFLAKFLTPAGVRSRKAHMEKPPCGPSSSGH